MGGATSGLSSARIVPNLGGDLADVPLVSVDGAFSAAERTAPHLNLSHWPGNSTPAALKRDLSTGIALAFARLPAAERDALCPGARLVVNNHYDTDGCCASFALLRPDLALPRAERLLAIAACGDFFALPDEDAFCCDLVLTHLADPERSPLAAELEGLDDHARYTRAQAEGLRILPALCDGNLRPYESLWAPELAALREDCARLAAADRSHDAELDCSVWSDVAGEPGTRLPGRHALFADGDLDRALFLESSAAGTRARFVLSTLSWFDLPSRTPRPRPDLEALAAELNELEGASPDAARAWRAQGARNASPELWFGGADQPSFAEHNDQLAPSRLGPAAISERLRAALP